MSHNESQTTSPPLFVSTLCVHLKPQSQKEIETVVVEAGRVTKQINETISPGGSYEQAFDPPLEVLFGTKLTISVHYRQAFRRVVQISLDPQDVLSKSHEECGRLLYRKTEGKVEIMVGVQPLPSTVSEILASCSRFRVLIIGETGIGKSSLIIKVFSVAGVDVSDTTRGQANIDQEYIAPDNELFIVHDSCGFEAADQQNLNVARDFIAGRRRMPDLKDQLHAIWLCLPIPYAGGRLLQAGVEDFLKNRKEILGNIPLVVVFTKLDLLENMLLAEAEGDSISKALETLCLAPLHAAVGSDNISHVAVSTMSGYEESLATLADVTAKNIRTYIKNDAVHLVAAIAQRVNINLKIALTIAVGEKRYWKALMASSSFQGHTLKACLHVIHQDIVRVWNFNNPDDSLEKECFKATLFNDFDLGVREAPDHLKTVRTSMTLIAALVTIIAGVAGTGGVALPIVVPIVGAAVLGKVAHDLYKASQDVVKRLMAYIVDLTCIMQILFLLVSTPIPLPRSTPHTSQGEGEHGTTSTSTPTPATTAPIVVDTNLLNIAIQAYACSRRDKVHTAIDDFEVGFVARQGRRDAALEKIRELIEQHAIKEEELPELRRELMKK